MIYILDQDLAKSAQALDDKSLDKQIKDIAQVLCNVHEERIAKANKIIENAKQGGNTELQRNMSFYLMEQLIKYDIDPPLKYKTNKKLLLWSKWARTCKANYLYLVEYGLVCVFEWEHRHDEKFDNIGWRKQSINKHLKVLRWARNNVPDLPVKNEKISIPLQLTGTGGFGYFPRKVSYETTPFPLVIPKKYILFSGFTIDSQQPYLEKSIIRSYRNYYQAKLEQYFNKLQKHHSKHFNGFDGFNCDCEYTVKWTNRNKPEWLEV